MGFTGLAVEADPRVCEGGGGRSAHAEQLSQVDVFSAFVEAVY